MATNGGMECCKCIESRLMGGMGKLKVNGSKKGCDIRFKELVCNLDGRFA